MKVFLVAGARPNFMKIAPIYRESRKYPQVECKVVHTGQHYDHIMSDVFFDELGLPKPAYFLGVGSGSHAQQTARVMTGFEKVCEGDRPDLVLVVGDVNSTLACTIVAKKLGIRVAHVEAGLRSFDLNMPEEINRMATDAISDLFFVTEQSAMENLCREGKSDDSIHFVGHVMIDNLYHQLKRLDGDESISDTVKSIKNGSPEYAFLTLHRPSNVDDPQVLHRLAGVFNIISVEMPIVFPVHPRTRKNLQVYAVNLSDRIITLPPLSFREALYLWKDASVVLTDSGGLQEESTALGVPCLTLRENTERPVTVQMGSNVLVGSDPEVILREFIRACDSPVATLSRPPKWDGMAAERIWSVLLDRVQKEKAS